jgi:hypothetical protein
MGLELDWSKITNTPFTSICKDMEEQLKGKTNHKLSGHKFVEDIQSSEFV